MGESAQLIALWRRARARGEQVCLATVVHVEGSSYRKPGARMLVTAGGERTGTISGGCLEAEVSRKAWWLTAGGARVEQYQSSFDEDGGGVPWGLGCGGTVSVLLERNPATTLQALEASLRQGAPAVLVSRLSGTAGTLAVVPGAVPPLPRPLAEAAAQVLQQGRSMALDAQGNEYARGSGELPVYFLEYLAPPPRLTIFGAGDDAQPIAHFADALGWRVSVADGRSHLLRRERFPLAAELRLLQYRTALHADAATPVLCGLNEQPLSAQGRSAPSAATKFVAPKQAAAPEQPAPGQNPPSPDVFPRGATSRTHFENAEAEAEVGVETGVEAGELAVILTHSFDQDRALLTALLPRPLAYLGILGPRHRTLRLLAEVAPALGWTEEQCLARLHSPVGLDLGARDPASIALSIVAHLQAVLAGRRVEVQRVRHADPLPIAARG